MASTLANHLPALQGMTSIPEGMVRKVLEALDDTLLKSNKKHPELGNSGCFSGCGGRTRTYGLRVMSPTSCQLLHAAISTCFPSMVPVTGLEPVRYRYRGILSPLCLPIPPHRRISAIDRIPYAHPDVNSFLQTKIFYFSGIFQGGTA